MLGMLPMGSQGSARTPEEFEEHVKHSDSMTQFCSPSLEFVPGSEENISTRMLEQGTQTRRPLLQTLYPFSPSRAGTSGFSY